MPSQRDAIPYYGRTGSVDVFTANGLELGRFLEHVGWHVEDTVTGSPYSRRPLVGDSLGPRRP